jgi:hypothetical protein
MKYGLQDVYLMGIADSLIPQYYSVSFVSVSWVDQSVLPTYPLFYLCFNIILFKILVQIYKITNYV